MENDSKRTFGIITRQARHIAKIFRGLHSQGVDGSVDRLFAYFTMLHAPSSPALQDTANVRQDSNTCGLSGALWSLSLERSVTLGLERSVTEADLEADPFSELCSPSTAKAASITRTAAMITLLSMAAMTVRAAGPLQLRIHGK